MKFAEQRDRPLTPAEQRQVVRDFCAARRWRDERVLVIVPDNTRSGPIGALFQMLFDELVGQVAALDVLVALGTHQPMSEEQVCRRLEMTPAQRRGKYAGVEFFNHAWDQPETFRSVGRLRADLIAELSGGRFREAVDVAINKLVFDYDGFVILGPVFPHEVVGFSGGHKYIFPGIAGPEIINFFHWLGALVTNPGINGFKWTPTRAVVEAAAEMVPVPHWLLGVVAVHGVAHGLYAGETRVAWERAADLSAELHIIYKDRAFHTVLGIAPEMYDDLWVAGKVMYKLEPIVADGGTLIIYAPHINEVSYTHGAIIDRIGYHTRDYFLGQMERFAGVPRGVLAHSTHVRGVGAWQDGVERPRINVVLATGIPAERCARINLGYLNPAAVDVAGFADREAEGVLVVPHAGEMLHRLRSGAIPGLGPA